MVAEAFLGMALPAVERTTANVAPLHCGECEIPMECMADRIKGSFLFCEVHSTYCVTSSSCEL